MRNYKSIFERVEQVLLDEASKGMPRADVQAALDEFKHIQGRRFSDSESYRKLVHIIYYAGFTANTVSQKLPTINKWFPDFTVVADYDEAKLKQVLADPDMIKFEDKARANILNAREFKKIVKQYGSFHDYVDSFNAQGSSGNWVKLKDDLRGRFARMGLITPYHFMMDIGLPVMKPDRVVARIFYRLGLIAREEIKYDSDAEAVVRQGEQFANTTGYPIRYIDIVFVCYGQVRSLDIGLAQGICLKDRPRCKVCKVTNDCGYFKTHHSQVGQQTSP
jgi:DNA-3-methyladenine glycosylase I